MIQKLSLPILLLIYDTPIHESPLKPGTIQNADLVPLSLRFQIRDSIPDVLVGQGHSTQIRGRELRVDTVGNNKLDKTVSRAAQTVTFQKGTASVPILLFRQDDCWFAAPAATMRALIGKFSIEFLDANTDGNYFTTNDWVRFDEGAFFRLASNNLLASNDTMWSGSSDFRVGHLRQSDPVATYRCGHA